MYGDVYLCITSSYPCDALSLAATMTLGSVGCVGNPVAASRGARQNGLLNAMGT